MLFYRYENKPSAGGIMEKLTVSQLTGLIKQNLEEVFPLVIVEGEVSNLRLVTAGHLYFSLKDSGAKIDAAMFKNRSSRLRFEPHDGMLVRATGSISVYPPRGNYQLVCDELEQAGEGEILAMLEKRKRALAAEGLFDEERKKPIPEFPEAVGVVSSATGAAVRDILNILRRRASGIRVVIFPSLVQGEGAAETIARRIEQANAWNKSGALPLDVLIVGRGGGSIADLLPFSEEEVVRAIAASELPVISAVGHEIDNPISDLAADLRAPTPSAAAELVSGDRSEMLETVEAIVESMTGVIQHRLERARMLVRPFSAEDMEFKFRSIIQPYYQKLDDAKEELVDSIKDAAAELRRRLDLARTALEAASPLSVLERGFAVVTNERTGKILRSAKKTKAGDKLSIRLLEGTVKAVTEETE
jgi:exodeoxyribonuclease VII large subunit